LVEHLQKNITRVIRIKPADCSPERERRTILVEQDSHLIAWENSGVYRGENMLKRGFSRLRLARPVKVRSATRAGFLSRRRRSKTRFIPRPFGKRGIVAPLKNEV
jgi:hypothetical protein